jgi:UrcA family protein
MNTTTISTSLRALIATAIFGALASSFAAVSVAADSNEAPKTIVKFEDLNVSNPQGAAVLYARIRAAAEGVCGPNDYPYLPFNTRTEACVHKAIADAVTAVNRPALIAVYNAKNRSPLPIVLAAGQSR